MSTTRAWRQRLSPTSLAVCGGFEKRCDLELPAECEAGECARASWGGLVSRGRGCQGFSSLCFSRLVLCRLAQKLAEKLYLKVKKNNSLSFN